MFLNVVTITGADDEVSPLDLVRLYHQFGFVEFGILFKKGTVGPRYPSRGWVDRLFEVARQQPFSAHLCGGHVADLINGDPSWFEEFAPHLRWFSRMQINMTAEQYRTVDLCRLYQTIQQGAGEKVMSVILQSHNGFDRAEEIHGCNEQHGTHFDLLHDASGGRGRAPEQWPSHPNLEHLYCGYAGGLSPDNITSELEKIRKACGSCTKTKPVWIDMESGVREDNHFSIPKVEVCLSAVRGSRWDG